MYLTWQLFELVCILPLTKLSRSGKMRFHVGFVWLRDRIRSCMSVVRHWLFSLNKSIPLDNKLLGKQDVCWPYDQLEKSMAT